ncbi:MAG: glycoside hydrolase superfamily [Linnemannia elongata]|nr:MAG: glycoside hydrolase superfamily [Linnemannia elongata]
MTQLEPPPPSSSTRPPTTAPSTRLRVEPEDIFLRDASNRAWLLRGVNLSGSCKFPRYPATVTTDAGTTGRDEDNNESISFVGRPFELHEADEHLTRLRHWGFRMIRWVITWEAVEHAGPGVYDQEFLDYTVKALLKAKEYGFKVMIDFHQDVWSRFSGGSGAPLWTFYAAGLDPHHFAATGAAAVHNTLQDNEPLLRMVWLTNYYKLACATMFTLFYAGRILAPNCTFEKGVNIQDYLQGHFLGAIRALVDRIHDCRDEEGRNLLEDDVVVGYDSWNEPSNGWIGLERLDVLPEQHDMRQGDMPTPLQSLMLGEGLTVQNVATFQLELVGPVKTGSRTIQPSAHPDAALAGECLWAQHGVWSIRDRKVLQQDYFARGPWTSDVQPLLIQWVPDHWLTFAKRVIELVRSVHPTAILFLEPPVYVPAPDLVSETKATKTPDEAPNQVLLDNMVYTPHHYDDLVLLTKKYLGWVNIDLLGLSRGRHKSLYGSIIFGKKATESLFGSQIGEIQKECYGRLATTTATVAGRGLPVQSNQFVKAFDNILQGLDRTLAHYTLWNYTIENTKQFGDGWNGEDLSLYSAPPSTLTSASISTTTETTSTAEETMHPLDRGGRAVEQFCRPYPVATVGQPTRIMFDRYFGTFRMWTKTDGSHEQEQQQGIGEGVRSEIYIPQLHFPDGPTKCRVEVSDGSWEWDTERQLLFWTYGSNATQSGNGGGGGAVEHWLQVSRKL